MYLKCIILQKKCYNYKSKQYYIWCKKISIQKSDFEYEKLPPKYTSKIEFIIF